MTIENQKKRLYEICGQKDWLLTTPTALRL